MKYSDLVSLKRSGKLIKNNIYTTELGMFKALSIKSFVPYNISSGTEIIISDTQPINPKEGMLWINTNP